MQLLPKHLGPGAGLLVALLLPGGASAAAPSNPLEREERLARPIDIAVKEQPLVDVVARVGKDAGIALATSEEVADERVTLFARHRPARELLTRIAQHLDYSWVRQTRRGVKTLVLIQDLAARRREEALRGGMQREIDKLRGMVEEQAALSETPEGREIGRKSRQWRVERIQELDELLNGKWVVEASGGASRLPAPPSTPQQRERFNHELRLLYHATPGRGSFHALDAAARFYSALPPEGQTALWNGESIRFAYPAEANRVPLPREVALALGEGSLGTTAQRTDETTGRDLPVPLQSLDRLRGEFWLERRGVGINLRVRLRTLGSIGDEKYTSRVERVFQDDVESGRNWPSLPTGPLLEAKAAGLRDSITLPPDKKTPPGEEPSTRFADVLEKLAARVPYPILADGYTTGVLSGQFVVERKPLAEVLARVCRTFGRRCSYDQGYLLLRHHDWATRRAMEPSARRVQQWEKDLETYGALPLRDLIEIGGRLTPEQIELLQVRWRGQVPEGIYRMLEADTEQSGTMLRLLSTLPAGTWRSLEAGQPLPLRALPAAGHRYARLCLLEATEQVGGFFEDPSLDGKPWVPERGFLEEDRQEAALGMVTLALKRQPATWFIGSMGFHLTPEVKKALEAELPFNPKATEKDLKRIEGELIEVTLTVPGAEPVSHFFIVPVVKQP